ncbi:hypothetical protein MMC29_006210 [Sticta canariensis]|nr:hypothetical protein [Sticta canariensis]
MDPETQVNTVAELSFFTLSLELRYMIYRLLLVADKPLGTVTYPVSEWASFGRYDLHPAILCTCWQVFQEASAILKSENTFGIYISGAKDISGDTPDRHSLPYWDHDDEWAHMYPKEYCIFEHHEGGWVVDSKATTGLVSFCLDIRTRSLVPFNTRVGKFEGNFFLRRVQRLEIVMTFAEPWAIRLHAEILCTSILRKMPALRHVCIRVANDTSDTKNTALGPFGMLRNMRSVVIHGVPLPLAERLRSLMLGNTPPGENVESMYDVLDAFVTGMNGNRLHLLKAYLAMLDWDVEKFKEFRSKILSESLDQMGLLLLHVYDHDVKSEQDHQAKIEENDVGNVGEDRDEKPGDH